MVMTSRPNHDVALPRKPFEKSASNQIKSFVAERIPNPFASIRQISFAPSTNLPDARDSRHHFQAFSLPDLAIRRLVNGQRSRPDQRHVAQQYVDQLRQFVDAAFSQVTSDLGNSRIVADFECWTILFAVTPQRGFFLFGINAHGSKLDDPKRSAILAFALLSKENRAA